MKKLLSFFITCSLLCGTFFSAFSADYTGHWAEETISKLMAQGIVSGDGNGNVRPDDTISRAEFVKLTNRYFSFQQKAPQNFADVDSDMWYAPEFLIARQAGYLQGDEAGNANPEALLSRAEVCVILSKILDLTGDAEADGFTDRAEIPVWAAPYVSALYGAGYLTGYSDGSFRPFAPLLRGEAFSLLSRLPRTEETGNNTVGDGNLTIGGPSGFSGGSSGGSGGSGGSSGNTVLSAPAVLRYDTQEQKLYFREVKNATSYQVEVSSHEITKLFSCTVTRDGTTLCADLSRYIQEICGQTEDWKIELRIRLRAVGTTQSAFTNAATVQMELPHLDTPVPAETRETVGEQENAVITWTDGGKAASYRVELTIDGERADELLVFQQEKRAVLKDLARFEGKSIQVSVRAISGDESVKDSDTAILSIHYGGIEGAGTLSNPYLLRTAHDFEFMRENTAAVYQLNNNVTLTAFEPIPEFSGTFIGGGNTVTLDINKPSTDKVALFGTLSGSVSGLVTKGFVVGKSEVGAVAGNILVGGSIKECVNYASITGSSTNVGGISGNTAAPSSSQPIMTVIAKCVNYGDVTGTGGQNHAGIVGFNMARTIVTLCANYGTVSGMDNTGGVAGVTYGSVTASFNAGSVSGKNAGGVLGAARVGSAVTGCYNVGNVIGNGILGNVLQNTSVATVSFCYNAGEVSGQPIGKHEFVQISNCFYLGDKNDAYEGTEISQAELSSVNAKTQKMLNNGFVFNEEDDNPYPSIIDNPQLTGNTEAGIPEVSDLRLSRDRDAVTVTWRTPGNTDKVRITVMDKETYLTVLDEEISAAAGQYTFRIKNELRHYGVTVYVVDKNGNLSAGVQELFWVDVVDLIPPAEAAEISYRTSFNKITIRFQEPEDPDYTGTEVYLDGVLYTTLEKGTQEIVISELSENTSYTIKLVTFDAEGNRSEGIELKLQTVESDIFQKWISGQSFEDEPVVTIYEI